MTVEKPKPKQLLRPITTGKNSAMNQSQFLANTCNSLVAREKSRVHGAIGFGFASHWLKKKRESFKPIIKCSNRNHVITFDSHLKTAQVIWIILHSIPVISSRNGNFTHVRTSRRECIKGILTYPNESTIFASATDICILVVFVTARGSPSCDSREAVAAATNISLRTPGRKTQDLKRYKNSG